jgi:hypothetical protein
MVQNLTDNYTGFDGQKLSKDNAISVEWLASEAPLQGPNDLEDGIYMNGAQSNFTVPSMLNLSRVSKQNRVTLQKEVPIGGR